MSKKVIGGVLAGMAIAASVAVTCWDYAHTVYECHDCGAIHKPTPGAYCMGMHVPGRRLLKCPSCGNRNWHYRTPNQ